jgi:hypothetical protein
MARIDIVALLEEHLKDLEARRERLQEVLYQDVGKKELGTNTSTGIARISAYQKVRSAKLKDETTRSTRQVKDRSAKKKTRNS